MGEFEALDADLIFKNNFTTILIAFAFPIAIQGTYRSIKIALSETLLIYKLNLFQSSLLLINVVVDLVAVFYRKHDCLFQFYLYQVISYCALLLIYWILFLKAYYANKSTKFIGFVFVICQLARLAGMVQTIRSSTVFRESIGVCTVESAAKWSLLLLVSETVIVLFLSFMFMKKILTQSDYIPSKAYAMLIKHGFALPVVICIVNIIFSILMFSKIPAITVEHLLRIGWITNAWLIMKQSEHSYYLHKRDQVFESSNLQTAVMSASQQDLNAKDTWDLYLGVKHPV
ncbi:hypothetical protein K493DRAFT_385770 [Basidiobolus meristosporus CBS 931.73]|uniref:G-protein coupled receptors family 1 profile domain-containing protein n=1 Tax=Basidiobolus meristosporus CBS 931.73 TaxID=1314790 RepID=A0A1Y1XPT1_9FUNG|nr:hypothetical protein K493DRAFT_385770 [Basidiobolus meristosporus CBS 931.73]|eukprot:ORX87742.1 hypothetical protein K493DRAFT_385770 [Basidiobolus meristosporus CBS 931.73]